jgi:hypothetical protein
VDALNSREETRCAATTELFRHLSFALHHSKEVAVSCLPYPHSES